MKIYSASREYESGLYSRSEALGLFATQDAAKRACEAHPAALGEKHGYRATPLGEWAPAWGRPDVTQATNGGDIYTVTPCEVQE